MQNGWTPSNIHEVLKRAIQTLQACQLPLITHPLTDLDRNACFAISVEVTSKTFYVIPVT